MNLTNIANRRLTADNKSFLSSVNQIPLTFVCSLTFGHTD